MFKKNTVLKSLLLGGACISILPSISSAMDLTLDGFGSAYYGQSYSSNLLPYGFADTSANFTEFSLIGLNIKSKINDQFSVAAQLIATGSTQGTNTNYSLFADWAYINYTPIDGLNIRAGRQRYPVFTASEYINEHEQLPFRVMPSIIYNLAPFDSFDGVSVTKTIDVGSNKLQLSIFGGDPVLNLALGTTYLGTGVPFLRTADNSNLLGAKVTFEGDGFRLRAQASRSTVTSTSTVELLPTFGGNSSFYEAHEEVFHRRLSLR